jgi:O-antigen/teichoic acid export membrane protein
VASVLRSISTFLASILLARWLGPEEFGRFIFLIASHIALRQFLDMGTSSAFFTFISQRLRSNFFILVYWLWIFAQLAIYIFLIWFLLPDKLVASIWSGEEKGLILLALLASFMQGTIFQAASQMAEASRETIRLQVVVIFISFSHLLLLILAWISGFLAIEIIFSLIIFEWFLGSFFAVKFYYKSKRSLTSKEQSENFKSIYQEYFVYCLPLIPLAWFGALHDYADRRMLQEWGGATEQAYFGLAMQISSITLLVTTAVIKVFWKEIAEANENQDYERIGFLFSKLSKILIFIGALLAGFFMPWSDLIILLTAGEQYISGSQTLTLLFIYPIHQCLGQLTNTLFYATSKTRLMTFIHISHMSVGLILAYLFLAPYDSYIPGFNLGSQGLALKLVLVQFIFVNIAIFFISKNFKWKFEWFHQILVVSIFLLLGFFSFYLSQYLLSSVDSYIYKILLHSFIYLFLSGSILFKFTTITGFSLEQLGFYTKKLIRRD